MATQRWLQLARIRVAVRLARKEDISRHRHETMTQRPMTDYVTHVVPTASFRGAGKLCLHVNCGDLFARAQRTVFVTQARSARVLKLYTSHRG